MTDFLVVTALCALLLGVLQAMTCVISLRSGRFRIVDQVWGLGLALVAVCCALIGTGDPTRRVILAILVSVWGLRLSTHIVRRSWGAPEDPRYAELVDGRRTASAALSVFGIQWVAQWFVSLPVQVSAVTGPPAGAGTVLVAAGAALILVGMIVESVADRQMQRFKATHAGRGRIMDHGLWGWSRHPNYFGDAVVWVGVFLMAAAVWPGVLTVLSPAAMVWFLVVATGARRLERHMADRPGYTAYQRRTSFFIPWPPRTTGPTQGRL